MGKLKQAYKDYEHLKDRYDELDTCYQLLETEHIALQKKFFTTPNEGQLQLQIDQLERENERLCKFAKSFNLDGAVRQIKEEMQRIERTRIQQKPYTPLSPEDEWLQSYRKIPAVPGPPITADDLENGDWDDEYYCSYCDEYQPDGHKHW